MNAELLEFLISDADDSVKKKPFAKISETSKEFENLISEYPTNTKTKERWKSKNIVPLENALQGWEGDLDKKVDYVTDYKDSSKFLIPENSLNPSIAYFIGVAAGDGGFNGDKVWTLVDGGKRHQLRYSKKFLESIAVLLQNYFGVNTGIRKRGNMYEIYVSNKWFCRFLQNYYNLPESYKKGKLFRPESFSTESQISAFWRGVFDADGSVANKSNRISLSSATKSFLEQCKYDLEKQGVMVHEIRKPNAYLLRLKPAQLPIFAEKIGFSHPRKKKLLLEKLEKGSRNYVCLGRIRKVEGHYPLAEIKELRVLNSGEKLKEFREQKDLYQKELASNLGVSKNQIWSWENDKDATPIIVLAQLFETEKEMCEYLIDSQNKFKYGVRGNGNSAVCLPKKTSTKIDEIAEKCVATAQEVRIKDRDKNMAEKVEKTFDVAVKDADKLFVRNKAVFNFFSKFYVYEPVFKSWSKERIDAIDSKLAL